MTKRLLYSMIDSKFPVSSRIQHKIIAEFASEVDCKIGFYGAEDPEFFMGSPYLASKLPDLLCKYSGVIFFSVFQLPTEDILSIIRATLDRKLEVYFACQRIRISNHIDFERDKILLIAATTAVKTRTLTGILSSASPTLNSN